MMPPIKVTKIEDFQRLGLSRAELVVKYIDIVSFQPTYRYQVEGQLYDVPVELVLDGTVI